MDSAAFIRSQTGRMSDEAIRRALGLKPSAYLAVLEAINRPITKEPDPLPKPKPEAPQLARRASLERHREIIALAAQFSGRTKLQILYPLNAPDISTRDLCIWLMRAKLEASFGTIGRLIKQTENAAGAAFKKYDASIEDGSEPTRHKGWRKMISERMGFE